MPKVIDQKKGIVKKIKICVRAVIINWFKTKKIYPDFFPILYNIQPRSLKHHLEKLSSNV